MASGADLRRLKDKDETLTNLRLLLKPKCDVKTTVRAMAENTSLTKVDCHVYKDFSTGTKRRNIVLLLESIGRLENLVRLDFFAKGITAQPCPLEALTTCLNEAVGLEILVIHHVVLEGTLDQMSDFAYALQGHPSLNKFVLQTESVEDFTEVIEGLALCQSLESVEITSTAMSKTRGTVGGALKILFTSSSLREITLNIMAFRFEKFQELTKVLGANQVLERLTLQDEELDNASFEALGNMIITNKTLKKFHLKLDKLHGDKLADVVRKALEINETLQIFELTVDGRLTDLSIIRSGSILLKKNLPTFQIEVDVGLSMGLKCIRTG